MGWDGVVWIERFEYVVVLVYPGGDSVRTRMRKD